MNNTSLPVAVERWTAEQPRFAELRQVIATAGQTDWYSFRADWHHSSHTLVALQEMHIVGFLRFVVQAIGPELDRPAVALNGRQLTEAKVLAFAVLPTARRQGIGILLQQATLAWAKELGCYQLRSHSSGSNQANHALKLKLGFAVHPVVRGEDKEGVYFIMPLQ